MATFHRLRPFLPTPRTQPGTNEGDEDRTITHEIAVNSIQRGEHSMTFSRKLRPTTMPTYPSQASKCFDPVLVCNSLDITLVVIVQDFKRHMDKAVCTNEAKKQLGIKRPRLNAVITLPFSASIHHDYAPQKRRKS